MESLERSRCNGKAHVGQANDERDRRLKVHQRLCRARKARSAAQSSTAPNRNGARTREIQRRCAGSGARWSGCCRWASKSFGPAVEKWIFVLLTIYDISC